MDLIKTSCLLRGMSKEREIDLDLIRDIMLKHKAKQNSEH